MMKNCLINALFILAIFASAIQFQSCDPDDCDDERDCDTCSMVYKPNIYIYPETTIDLNVTLSFPLGGNVVTSIPEYGSGWQVSVEPSGLIDGEFGYLFYESRQPYIWQTSMGWSVLNDSLESFFRDNMSLYGFDGKEIDDFIEYWIPRLSNSNYYSVFPQTSELIEQAIELNFSEQPEKVLRLFYVIKETSGTQFFEEPEIVPFNREGFIATEWGVIID